MGGMILAMISGHTGRPLQTPKLMSIGYIAIIVGAILRVALPGWFPEGYSWAIGLAGGLWILGYGIYVFYYGPMLVAARVDGSLG